MNNNVVIRRAPPWKLGSKINLGLINAQSLGNKSTIVSEYVNEHDFGVVGITETWLRDGDDPVVLNLCPPGFTFLGVNRPLSKSKGRGGGVGFLVRKSIPHEQVKTKPGETFESTLLKVSCCNTSAIIALIYRPPPSQKNGFTTDGFLREFEEYLASLLMTYPGKLYLMGDFNFHMEKPNDPKASLFCTLLSSLGLTQHVANPTHRDGGLLDLIITREDSREELLHSVTVHSDRPSDHHIVSCALCLKPPQQSPRKVKTRSIGRIQPPALAAKLREVLAPPLLTDLDESVIDLNSRINSAINQLAPLREIKLKGETSKPWYSDEIHSARRKRRAIERKLRKSGLEVHRQMLQDQRKNVVVLIDRAKSSYLNDKIQNASSKEVFQILDGLLNIKAPDIGENQNTDDLCETLASFFSEKITKIRTNLDAAAPAPNGPPAAAAAAMEPPVATLSSFQQISIDQLKKIISSITKTCPLDPIPVFLLKEPCVENELMGQIREILNNSLAQGAVPPSLKIAQVRPRVKKAGADPLDPSNLRPISNLPTIEKMLEKAVAKQLQEYLQRHEILDPLQSAFRPVHSTETAILKVQNDALLHLDNGDGMLLVLLDLSAAFDTLDHTILLDRLHTLIGITGSALDWLKSYLSGRRQYVKINESSSEHHDLSIGVPQGSVLGPLLFILYTRPLGDIFRRHNIQYHQYADDTQAYCSLPSKNPAALREAITRMERCLSEVSDWMLTNKLKMNEKKTECIIFASKKNRHVFQNITIEIGSAKIKPEESVRNLGAYLDSELTMEKHVNNTIRNGYYHLRRIARISCHLDQASRAKAVVAYVSSRLDCHNGLLTGATQKQLRRLQVLQNNAARLVTRSRHHCHMTPILSQLHWLPVKERITFKILSLVHSAIYMPSSPSYLQELCRPPPSGRTLRSNANGTLAVPRTRMKMGDAAFASHACRSWNTLPPELRAIPTKDTFKSHLKTFLFNVAFN